MSKYNPATDMPKTLAEWNELVDFYTNKSQTEYKAAVAAAREQAKAAFDAGRDAQREKMLAELEANLAAVMIETPEGLQSLPEAEYKKAWDEGVSRIDIALAQQREQYIEQAESMVPQPQTRADFEQMYACYYPQPVPEAEPAPTTEELFAQLRSYREVRLREYDTKISQLDRLIREHPDYAAYQLERAAWDEYATALCNLTLQEGAPWDGGGPLTPWPAKPE